ncbi:MAG: hypothetical protein HZA31_13830 [Opitutae bacterium]|nr:hypothetical protein [Opitutae bacterium]
MRHVDLKILLATIFANKAGQDVSARLFRAHKKAAGMAAANRKSHSDRNGPNKWKPVKDLATAVLGNKCWYTEVELVGAPLGVDHYRPVCDYWWLAYDPENYRIACDWANSPKHNSLYGCAGGKGDNFPLLAPRLRAKGKKKLRVEKPIILDPCVPTDCELLAFQVDGRPVLNPKFNGDAIARDRVEQSKILLNLDHPEFNSKREQLCNDISTDVRTYEALPANSPERVDIKNRLAARLGPKAPYSVAARLYLSLRRDLDWVQTILDNA